MNIGRMSRSLAVVSLTITATTLAGGITSPAAHAADLIPDTSLIWPDPGDPDGNTGDNGAPTPDEVIVSVPDLNATQTKLLEVENMRPYVVAEIAGVDPAVLSAQCQIANAVDECGRRVPPPSAVVPSYTFYRQTTGYTCAPSSARSILKSLTGNDFGEFGLANEMKTSSAHGTTWTNISPVLNRHQGYDHFLGEPEGGKLTPEALMNYVVYDVAVGNAKRHAAMLNVDQSRLTYWNRSTPGRHYLTAYGYNNPGKTITLGDVAGSHYGTHVVSLTEAYTAEVANKGLVIY